MAPRVKLQSDLQLWPKMAEAYAGQVGVNNLKFAVCYEV